MKVMVADGSLMVMEMVVNLYGVHILSFRMLQVAIGKMLTGRQMDAEQLDGMAILLLVI